MAKRKHQKITHGKHSSIMHNTKQRIAYYSSPATKKIILSIIFFISFTLIALIICTPMLIPENRIKSIISNLATDYYENYFYENLTTSDKFQQLTDPVSTLEKYHTYGLTPITIRDLLLYDNQKNSGYHDLLTAYCNEDATTIKFYMNPPYDRNSYHAEYTYSCNF